MSGEVLIVGGGPAGCAAAITLASAGRRVVLLERERAAAHKVCGEFLSHEALGELARLGVDMDALGAVTIRAVRLASSSASVAEASLPFAARSLTRRCLDDALLARAEALGVDVRRGCSVQRLEQRDRRWFAQLADSEFAAEEVVLATGKHDLHGHARGEGRQAGLVAFKMYFRLARAQAQALSGYVELLLYPGGYGGLQAVEGDAANLCCLIERAHLQRLGGWVEFLAHMQAYNAHVRARLEGAQPLLAKPLAISAIPYGFLRRRTEPHLWCVGDQAAVIPSFTGDGMAIALYSGRLAAEKLLEGATAQVFQEGLASALKTQISFATYLSRWMTASAGRYVAQTACAVWPGTLTQIAARTRLQALR